MHELGISRNIAAIVSEAAAGRRVRRITCEIGRLSGVIPGAISFCFEAVIKGTELEGASLEIREVEGQARCEACGSEFPVDTLSAGCACGSRRLVHIAGQELNVKSMELDEVV